MSGTARRVLIIGGTTGMGFAAAREVARSGAMVAITGRVAAAKRARAAELAAETGARILGFGADVRANCIAPGAIATEALDAAKQAALAKYGPPEDTALNRFMIENWGMKTAVNRVGQPQEVGELIEFLLSAKAAYLTGALINIDRGTDF